MDSVRSDHHIVFRGSAAREMNSDRALSPLEGIETVSQANSPGWQRRDQSIEKVRAPGAERGHVEPAQCDIHQDRSAAGAHQKVLVRTAGRRHPRQKTQVLQHARGVRPQHHACADLAQLLRPLIDGRFDADAVERHRRSNAADSAADNANVD